MTLSLILVHNRLIWVWVWLRLKHVWLNLADVSARHLDEHCSHSPVNLAQAVVVGGVCSLCICISWIFIDWEFLNEGEEKMCFQTHFIHFLLPHYFVCGKTMLNKKLIIVEYFHTLKHAPRGNLKPWIWIESNCMKRFNLDCILQRHFEKLKQTVEMLNLGVFMLNWKSVYAQRS